MKQIENTENTENAKKDELDEALEILNSYEEGCAPRSIHDHTYCACCSEN